MNEQFALDHHRHSVYSHSVGADRVGSDRVDFDWNPAARQTRRTDAERITTAVVLDAAGPFPPSERARVRAAQHAALLAGCRANVREGWRAEADLVWVHETVTEQIVAQARVSRDRGATVLYDVAASGEALFCRAPARWLGELLQLAHAVTADSRARAEGFAAAFGSDRVVVVPDVARFHTTH